MAGTPYGLGSMLKEGHKHFSGVEEAVVKNIEACKALSQITRTSMGPNGALTGAAKAGAGQTQACHAQPVLDRYTGCLLPVHLLICTP